MDPAAGRTPRITLVRTAQIAFHRRSMTPTRAVRSTPTWLKWAGAAAASLVLAACGKSEAPGAATAASAASTASAAPAKVYVVGTDAAYAPFESQNEKAEIVGFDIDLEIGRAHV